MVAANSGYAACHVYPHHFHLFFTISEYAVVSNFTLAFFEDSGWYKVDYAYTDSYKQPHKLLWGKGKNGSEQYVKLCVKL